LERSSKPKQEEKTMKFTTKIAQEVAQAKKTLTTLTVAATAALIWGGALAPATVNADAPQVTQIVAHRVIS
jgi:hypothetical protein